MSSTLPPPEVIDPPTESVPAGRSSAPEPPDASAASLVVDGEVDDEELGPLPWRIDVVVACGTVAAALMIGGVFEGASGRILATITGLMGVLTASLASRQRRPLLVNVIIIAGLGGAGILAVLPVGIDAVFRIPTLVAEANGAASQLRPPAELLPGWRLLLGWLMAIVGFTGGWIGREFRLPALGLLSPLPLLAWGAVSVPDDATLPTGLAAVVLFIVGLLVLSSAEDVQAAGDGSSPGLAFELRRAARAVPLLLLLVGALYGMSRTNVLFPEPLYDPTRDAQLPKAVPLSEVEDRVLFRVTSRIAGPWRTGILDVYDGEHWRLPPFTEQELAPVPANGIVDPDLEPTVRAEVEIAGLAGSVLPGIPRIHGLAAQGPRLAYDPRTGTIRLAQGQVPVGLAYTIVAAALPTEDELLASTGDIPTDLRRFTEMPDPPPAVEALLAEAPTDPWQRLDRLRASILEEVVVTGSGTPVAVPPDRVEDMLVGSREASPFEVVAAQAMLARWAGIPARIGYGFDGGETPQEPTDGAPATREVRPKHGASWLEVWFPGHGWFPVIGAPQQVRASLSTDQQTVTAEGAAEDTDIGVQLYVPLRQQADVALYQRIQRLVLLVVPLLLLLVLIWSAIPVAVKWWRRSRRRAAAAAAGPAARVAQAYSEFRDLCIDLGIPGTADSPLGFLHRLAHDPEHEQFAWLATRVLWGDLRPAATEVHAEDAEELGRVLRKRVAQAQPGSMRALAAMSRRSLQSPYDPDLVPPTRAERRRTREPAVVA